MIPQGHLSLPAFRMLLDYVREEIPRALSERRALEEKWLKWQRQYKCIPRDAVKQFPFLGASNLVLPIGATDVDTIGSRLAGLIFGPDRVWSTQALREDFIDYAPRLQEFLKWAQDAELNAYNSIIEWLMETTKLGTGVLKQRYRREQKQIYEFRETPQGIVENHRRIFTQDNPVQEHVSLYDFLVPAGSLDHQSAAWCGERLMLTWQQLDSRVRAGVYQGSGALQQWMARDRGSWLRDELERINLFHSGLANRFEIWETWLDFDIRGAGEPCPIVLSVHLPSMTPLRIDYNPFFHQERPFEVGRFLRQEKQFYGLGVMEMNEMFQEEVTTMHNQRIDANTISNAPMMQAVRGTNIREDEPVFIGRWILVDKIGDIGPVNFGRQPISTIGDEQATLQYKTQRVGTNDYIMGNSSSAVGYAALGTNMMQYQESAKRFDQTFREMRIALGNSGRRCTELYQQFNSQGKEFTVLGPKDGEIVRQILQFPLELIRHGVAIRVTATSNDLNKEAQIRTNMIIMQMTTQFYEQMFQGMAMAINPQIPPQLRMLATQMIVSGSTMMRRVLDSYDQQDADKLIPDMREILSGQQQQLNQLGLPGAGPQLGGPGAGPGGIAGAPGLLQAPGMGAVQQGAQAPFGY